MMPKSIGIYSVGTNRHEKTVSQDTSEELNVSVIAPFDLPEAFSLDVNFENKEYQVIVPEGGVSAGKYFKATLSTSSQSSLSSHLSENFVALPSVSPVEQKSEAHDNKWKDGIFACAKHGWLHPSLWNALCCPQFLMTQIQARLENEADKPKKTDSQQGKFCFSNMTAVFLGACLLDLCLVVPIINNQQIQAWMQPISTSLYGSPTIWAEVLYATLSLAMSWYSFLVLARLRATVRERAGIKTSLCGRAEDIVCVTLCHCCTVSQLARQTVDYEVEAAAWCTRNGLCSSQATIL